MNDNQNPETALAGCPFCGGKGMLTEDSAEHKIWWNVACIDYPDCIAGFTLNFDTKSKAIAAWNRRAPHPDTDKFAALLKLVRSEPECKSCKLRKYGDCEGLGGYLACPESGGTRADCPIAAIVGEAKPAEAKTRESRPK